MSSPRKPELKINEGEEVTTNDVSVEITESKNPFEEVKPTTTTTTTTQPETNNPNDSVLDLSKQELSNEESSLHSSDPIQPIVEIPLIEDGTLVTYNGFQIALQELLRFEAAIIPLTGLGPNIPPIPFPYNGMMEFGGSSANAILVDTLSALVGKEDPSSGLKASGGGNAGFGLVKAGMVKAPILITFVVAGYYSMQAMGDMTADLLNYHNTAADNFAALLTMDGFRAPIFFASSYVVSRGVEEIGMRMWNCCIPGTAEQHKEYPDLNALQYAGQYALRWFNNAMTAETVLYYLNLMGKETIGNDPRVQVGIFLLSDMTKETLRYLAFNISPMDTVIPECARKKDDEDEYKNPSNCDRAQWMVSKLSYKTILYLMSVGTFYGACTLAEYLSIMNSISTNSTNTNTTNVTPFSTNTNSTNTSSTNANSLDIENPDPVGSNFTTPIYTDNSTSYRMARYSMVFIPQAIESAVGYVIPAVVKGCSNMWSSLFGSSKAKSQGYMELPQNDVEDKDEYRQTLSGSR